MNKSYEKYLKYQNKYLQMYGGSLESNPLLGTWETLPLPLPPYKLIKPEHFRPALEFLFPQDIAAATEIANNPETPTFENTIHAFEFLGIKINEISNILNSITFYDLSDKYEAVDMEISPLLSTHSLNIKMLPKLFDRVKYVYDNRLGLDQEQSRLTEKIYREFYINGADLPLESQKRFKEIESELSNLLSIFQKNVNEAGKEEIKLNVSDLDGCSPQVIEKFSKGLPVGSAGSLLKDINNRDVRQNLWTRNYYRATDTNSPILKQIIRLRSEMASLFGKTYNEWKIETLQAKTPAKVNTILEDMWEKIRPLAEKDSADLEELSGIRPIERWDWAYWENKMRISRYSFDVETIKPYFSLETVKNAAFETANKLFGINVVHLKGVEAYHPDTEVYEIRENDICLGILITDYYSRPDKKGGAWTITLRRVYNNGQRILPVFINHLNYDRPTNDKPTLLSFRDSEMVFHEFGHALHGILSKSKYNILNATNVVREFLEFPSQFNETWLSQPEILFKYMKHYQTGETLPVELFEKIRKSSMYGKPSYYTKLISDSFADQVFHSVPFSEVDRFDISTVEDDVARKMRMPNGLGPMFKSINNNHLYSQTKYAAALYGYLWADFLVADAYEVVKNNPNGIFDKEMLDRLRVVYSSGDIIDAEKLFNYFTQREYQGPAAYLRLFFS